MQLFEWLLNKQYQQTIPFNTANCHINFRDIMQLKFPKYHQVIILSN